MLWRTFNNIPVSGFYKLEGYQQRQPLIFNSHQETENVELKKKKKKEEKKRKPKNLQIEERTKNWRKWSEIKNR